MSAGPVIANTSPIIALVIVEIAKQLPALAIDLVQVLSKPEATDADWDALRVRWLKPYEQKRAEALARAGG